MDKLMEFGRKAWFVVRVLSGYEERMIRSYRLQLQKRLENAWQRPACSSCGGNGDCGAGRYRQLGPPQAGAVLTPFERNDDSGAAAADAPEAADVEDVVSMLGDCRIGKTSFMAQARKEELRKHPEQVILSEVRQMVQQMQALNQQLEETETAIDEYFKPIDKNAQIIMDMQMEKEEKQMKEMVKVMQEQITMQREIAMKRAEATAIESNDTQVSEKMAENPPKQETIK